MIKQEIITAAKKAYKDYDVPASVTIAQFIVESAWGTKMPGGLVSNNPFGMKYNGKGEFVISRTREVINKKTVWIMAKFQKFSSFDEAFDMHGILMNKPIYSPAMKVWKTTRNVNAFVKRMAPIYATDPKYYTTIMSIIKTNNLTQYDVRT